jgi:hypothetical protein
MASKRAKVTEVPEFASREEELAWWDEHGAEVDLEAFPIEPMTFDVPARQPRSRQITLRVEPALVERYRLLAEERNMGYQTLMLEVLHAWKPRAPRKRNGPS